VERVRVSQTATHTVRVPGSTSNVGAGFDCVGFAVDRWLSASATVGVRVPGAAAVTIRRGGTLASLDLAPDDEAVLQGFTAACRARGRTVPERLELELHSDIPVARGLGSSSAALVAGASLANSALRLELDRQRLAELCAEIEGHPDNVGPAVFGGALLGVPVESDGLRRWTFAPIQIHPSLAFAFVVPEVMVETAAARAILPRQLSHSVAVKAAGKAAALAHGLVSGDAALLRVALDDVLHVPYRRHLVPAYEDVVRAARDAGAFGATLSGSGSTLLAVAGQDNVERVAGAMRQAFAVARVPAESFVQRTPTTLPR
jgi:homoserine kinase